MMRSETEFRALLPPEKYNQYSFNQRINQSFLQMKRSSACAYLYSISYLLFPSHATIFTLSTFTSSVTSLNSTSFSTNVHTLSQNLYVFRDPFERKQKIFSIGGIPKISENMTFTLYRTTHLLERQIGLP